MTAIEFIMQFIKGGSATDVSTSGTDQLPTGIHDSSGTRIDPATSADIQALQEQSGAQYLFSEYQASLADGAEIVSGWLDMATVDKWQGEFGAGVAGLTQVIETSSNPDGAGFTVDSTTTINTTFQLFNVIVRQRYLRVRWQNNTGSPVTGCYAAVKATYGSSDKLSVFPLSVSPTAFSQAALVQAVGIGLQPDGDYANTPADGKLATYETPLLAAGSVTLGPFDTDGYKSIELYVATDQVSGSQGIVVEYTPDAQAAIPVYYPGPQFTFGPDEVAAGFEVKRFAPAMDGFRVTYTNGGTDQGSFLLNLESRTSATENPGISVKNDFNATQAAIATRGLVVAEDANASGQFDNIEHHNGGLDTTILNHETDTPIRAADSWAVVKGTVSTTPTALPSTALANRISIEIHNADNTRTLRIGTSAAQVSAGQYRELDKSESIILELDESVTIYAASDSSTCAYEVIELGDSSV
jgi:hypothetical protein